MKLFKNGKSEKTVQASACGVPRLASGGFNMYGGKEESFFALRQLYDGLRRNVPVIDGAISKIVRLTGGFTVECDNEEGRKMLEDFLSEVPVDGTMYGIEAFITMFLEQLLTYGTAVGEMVMNRDMHSFSLYNGELENIVLSRSKENPLQVNIGNASGGKSFPVAENGRILLSVLDPEAGDLHGKSLLSGLPFISGILMQIFETIGANWERVGNLRYAVTYRPQNDAVDKAYAGERAKQIAAGWSEAMKSGEVRDFIAVGDVDIKVIGADNQVLDSDIPVRQLMEQIVAKTGLPPFLLGLNWSTSERMAKQQTDLLTSELWHYRRILTPVILRICRMYLRMNGLNDRCNVLWDDISLLDSTEQARTQYYLAQAEKYHAEADALGKEK